MGINSKIQDFWEDDKNSRIAHRAERFKLYTDKGMDNILELNAKILDCIKWSGKTMIDYGIGSGFVGHYLLKERGLRKYIGYDVSEKSIQVAKKENIAYSNQTEFIVVNNQEYDFPQWKADIFLSLACIQHFPTQNYLNKFLISLEESGIPIIALQIRYNEKTKFKKFPYLNATEVLRACHTNEDYISSFLKSYGCIYRSEANKTSQYQYLLYEVNK